MPRHLHWTELTGGIIATAVIVGLVVVIFRFARVGALHGKKVTLYVLTDDATGVLSGTEVWLGGQKAGLVKDLPFPPPSPDTLERLVIKTEILEEGLPNVRQNSYASIRSGDSMIGAIVVYISPGTAASPQLHDGDTVHVQHHSRIANLAKDVGRIEPAFSELAAQVRDLHAKKSHTAGT